jgi:hypothetical protein
MKNREKNLPPINADAFVRQEPVDGYGECIHWVRAKDVDDGTDSTGYRLIVAFPNNRKAVIKCCEPCAIAATDKTLARQNFGLASGVTIAKNPTAYVPMSPKAKELIDSLRKVN